MGLEKCNDCLYKFKLNTDEPCSYCKEIDLESDIKSSEYIKFNSKCSTCLYKDDVKKEAAKIRRYAQWLEQAVNGETINPRK